MIRGKGISVCPRQTPRPLVSEGLIPEIATCTRTSPGPGLGMGSSPTWRTSRAAPLHSYQAARISTWLAVVDIGLLLSCAFMAGCYHRREALSTQGCYLSPSWI